MSANKELSHQLSANLSRQELYFQYGVHSAVLWGMVMLPLIPASLSFSAIVSRFPEMLHIPPWLAYIVAAFTAAGIEFLGLSAVKLALRMRKYNLKVANTDFEQAPLGQGIIIAAAYLITVVMLTVFLKVFPDLAIWSLLPLAGMGALADWLIALQSDHNDRESHYDSATDATETEQSQAEVITTLTADIAKRDQQIDQLTTALDQLHNAMTAQIDQATAYITAQLTTQFEQRLAAQIDQLTTQFEQRLAAQIDQLTTAHNQRIEQLLDQIERLATGQSERLTTVPLDQAEQMPILPIIKIDHTNGQPTLTKLYTNGHIADDIAHLTLEDKIRTIAQRMIDAGQQVNKSEIHRILNCSRTTVTKVLG